VEKEKNEETEKEKKKDEAKITLKHLRENNPQ
jgi:hypothetical protein